MNKEHFLTELKIYLRPLTSGQISYILHMYEEKFALGKKAGKDEYTISKELGKPKDIAYQILDELGVEPIQENKNDSDWEEFTSQTTDSYDYRTGHPYQEDHLQPTANKNSFFIRFCQVSGVLLLNFFFMIWFLFILIALIGSGWVVALTFIASPFLAVIFGVSMGVNTLLQLFVTLILCGVGLIGLLILSPITKFFIHLLKQYTLWCFSVLKGGA